MMILFAIVADFNPRSHEGSDLKRFLRHLLLLVFQSTLPRRERLADHANNIQRNHNFNPRSHEGSDKPCKPDASIPGLFQSTLPRRERHGSVASCGCLGRISIHAPTKGATFSCPLYHQSISISIHAPTKGATAELT